MEYVFGHRQQIVDGGPHRTILRITRPSFSGLHIFSRSDTLNASPTQSFAVAAQGGPVRSSHPWHWHCLLWFTPHIRPMCGRVIQSSAPISYGIVDGMNVRDSRVHNYPPRWNGAPSQDLLVIRRNHKTGEVSLDPLRWGLIPYWCGDPKGGRKPINAKCETVRTPSLVPGGLS
jgi:SOS response associated peptidase (SRAP)